VARHERWVAFAHHTRQLNLGSISPYSGRLRIGDCQSLENSVETDSRLSCTAPGLSQRSHLNIDSSGTAHAFHVNRKGLRRFPEYDFAGTADNRPGHKILRQRTGIIPLYYQSSNTNPPLARCRTHGRTLYLLHHS
jgi:hypothetical protein